MTEDVVVEAFLGRHAVMPRPELDARNNEDRPPTFEEVIAKLFNDPSYEPTIINKDRFRIGRRILYV
jgi:hypothetical protein